MGIAEMESLAGGLPATGVTKSQPRASLWAKNGNCGPDSVN